MADNRMAFFKAVSQALNPSGSDQVPVEQPSAPAPAMPMAPGAGSILPRQPEPQPQITGDNYGGFFKRMQR